MNISRVAWSDPAAHLDLLMRVRAISKVGHLTDCVERLLAYIGELDRNLSGEKKQPTES